MYYCSCRLWIILCICFYWVRSSESRSLVSHSYAHKIRTQDSSRHLPQASRADNDPSFVEKASKTTDGITTDQEEGEKATGRPPDVPYDTADSDDSSDAPEHGETEETTVHVILPDENGQPKLDKHGNSITIPGIEPNEMQGKTSFQNENIERKNGEKSYEPLNSILATDPVTLSLYAKENNLQETDGWKELRSFRNTPRYLLQPIVHHVGNSASLYEDDDPDNIDGILDDLEEIIAPADGEY